MYPRLYAKKVSPGEWYPGYIQMYVERDVRLVKNIGDLSAFDRFLKLCAGRTACLLNLSSLAQDCGITHNTAKSWLSILETSYIIFLLQPHHENFNKRLVKNPKIYFYDTGLACHLLGIRTTQELLFHPMRGALFETLIISEFFKCHYNVAETPRLYYWKDVQSHEVDCIMEKSFGHPFPIEIKLA